MPLRRATESAAIVSLCAIGALYVLARSSAPILAPDSADYLAAAPVRLLGYPLFLKITGVKAAVLLQPVLFAIALIVLGLQILSATSSVVLAATVTVATMVNPHLGDYHASVLSESLAMTTLVLVLAAIVRFVRAPSSRAAAWAGIIAGIAATVRPTAYALLPVVPLMVLLERRRLPAVRTTLATALLAMLALPVAERLSARALHRGDITSLMGRVVFAKAGIVDASPAPSRSSDPIRASLEESLDATYAPIRDLIAHAPSRDVRDVLTLYYEGCLQWTCVDALRRSTHLPDPLMNDLAREAGLTRLERAPLRYLALWATHYRALWTAYPARHPATAPVLNAYLARRRPLPFEGDVFAPAGHYALEIEPYQPARIVRAMLFCAAWTTGALALLAVAAAATNRALPAPLAIASLASLAVHGSLLFTAALGVGASRMTVSVLPAVTMALLFTGWWLLGRLRQRRRTI